MREISVLIVGEKMVKCVVNEVRRCATRNIQHRRNQPVTEKSQGKKGEKLLMGNEGTNLRKLEESATMQATTLIILASIAS